MSDYQWNITSGGQITSGGATNTVQVSWNGGGTQAVGVSYTDLNGCTAATFTQQNVFIGMLPGIAGVISGPDTVCAGTNGVIYYTPPISSANAYEWTIPLGVTITSGAGTNQITVSFSPDPGAGIITVAGVNECGSGPPSPDFVVVMITSQPAPVVTAAGPLLTSSATSGNQWYYEGTGLIAGATLQTYTATVTGWYWTVVEGVGCPSLESNHVYVLFTGLEDQGLSNARIAPVPCDGRFTLSIDNPVKEEVSLLICNLQGQTVISAKIMMAAPGEEFEIDLREAGAGLYSVVLRAGKKTIIKKILVR
jgi:hypothetical protein